jgi:hypothetical protein
MGYYTVKVKPTIAASKQHAGTIDSGFVLFDWTGFEIPRGSGKLVSVTALIKPKGDTQPTQNKIAFTLIFSSSNDVSLGEIGAVQDRAPIVDIIGMVEFADTTFGPPSMRSTAIACTSNSAVGGHTPIIIAPSVDEPATAGYHKVYVGAVSQASSFDFTSINVINDTDINSTEVTDVVMAGSSMDVREHFAVGDVLHAQDDVLLGTVKSIAAATTGPITLTSATSGAGDATTVANGDTIYDINPITLVFGFED